MSIPKNTSKSKPSFDIETYIQERPKLKKFIAQFETMRWVADWRFLSGFSLVMLILISGALFSLLSSNQQTASAASCNAGFSVKGTESLPAPNGTAPRNFAAGTVCVGSGSIPSCASSSWRGSNGLQNYAPVCVDAGPSNNFQSSNPPLPGLFQQWRDQQGRLNIYVGQTGFCDAGQDKKNSLNGSGFSSTTGSAPFNIPNSSICVVRSSNPPTNVGTGNTGGLPAVGQTWNDQQGRRNRYVGPGGNCTTGEVKKDSTNGAGFSSVNGQAPFNIPNSSICLVPIAGGGNVGTGVASGLNTCAGLPNSIAQWTDASGRCNYEDASACKAGFTRKQPPANSSGPNNIPNTRVCAQGDGSVPIVGGGSTGGGNAGGGAAVTSASCPAGFIPDPNPNGTTTINIGVPVQAQNRYICRSTQGCNPGNNLSAKTIVFPITPGPFNNTSGSGCGVYLSPPGPDIDVCSYGEVYEEGSSQGQGFFCNGVSQDGFAANDPKSGCDRPGANCVPFSGGGSTGGSTGGGSTGNTGGTGSTPFIPGSGGGSNGGNTGGGNTGGGSIPSTPIPGGSVGGTNISSGPCPAGFTLNSAGDGCSVAGSGGSTGSTGGTGSNPSTGGNTGGGSTGSTGGTGSTPFIPTLPGTPTPNSGNTPGTTGGTCPTGFILSSGNCVAPVQTGAARCPNGATPTSRGSCYVPSIPIGQAVCGLGGTLTTFSNPNLGGLAVDLPDRNGQLCFTTTNNFTPNQRIGSGCNPVTGYCAGAFGVSQGNVNNFYYNPEGFRCPAGSQILTGSRWCSAETTTSLTCPAGSTTSGRQCIVTPTPVPTPTPTPVPTPTPTPTPAPIFLVDPLLIEQDKLSFNPEFKSFTFSDPREVKITLAGDTRIQNGAQCRLRVREAKSSINPVAGNYFEVGSASYLSNRVEFTITKAQRQSWVDVDFDVRCQNPSTGTNPNQVYGAYSKYSMFRGAQGNVSISSN